MKLMSTKKIQPICSRLIFNLTPRSYSAENIISKQDGCTMGGPLSVVLSDIHMIRTENEVVKPLKPKFYQRYVDDIISKRKKHLKDDLYEVLNSFHPKIELTIIKEDPVKFLDTMILQQDGYCTTKVFRKQTKLPISWTSNIPKRYKWNMINGELYRAKRISSVFQS